MTRIEARVKQESYLMMMKIRSSRIQNAMRFLFAMTIKEKSSTSLRNLFNQFRDELPFHCRHARDNSKGQYMDEDYNEALWSIDDILRR